MKAGSVTVCVLDTTAVAQVPTQCSARPPLCAPTHVEGASAASVRPIVTRTANIRRDMAGEAGASRLLDASHIVGSRSGADRRPLRQRLSRRQDLVTPSE